MNQVDMPVLSDSVCLRHWSDFLSPTEICAGYENGGKDFCSVWIELIWATSRQNQQMTVRPAKTKISLGIRPVWSESSLCAHSVCWFCHIAAHFCSVWIEFEFIVFICTAMRMKALLYSRMWLQKKKKKKVHKMNSLTRLRPVMPGMASEAQRNFLILTAKGTKMWCKCAWLFYLMSNPQQICYNVCFFSMRAISDTQYIEDYKKL